MLEFNFTSRIALYPMLAKDTATYFWVKLRAVSTPPIGMGPKTVLLDEATARFDGRILKPFDSHSSGVITDVLLPANTSSTYILAATVVVNACKGLSRLSYWPIAQRGL